MPNLSHFSDAQILKLLHKSDRRAFIYLYDTYAPSLYGAILKWVGSEDVAKQVLQKTFIKIWQNCTTIECMKRSIFAWMYAIANETAKAELLPGSNNQSSELVA